MAWITLTQDDLLGKLAAAELTAVKTKALAVGQVNPVPEEVASAIQEIRGRVAACKSNTLGVGATIPEELKPAALAILRYRVLTRLPVAGLITPQREREYGDALALLSAVAAGKFVVEQPATVSAQVVSGAAAQIVHSGRRHVDLGSL
jgi:hypothetical protein